MNGDWATIQCFVSRQIGKQYAFTGSLVAIVTPWLKTAASITLRLTAWWISTSKNGTSGIVAVGTTGESATLAVDEHLKVVESVVKRANKRVAVIAGTGANSTREAIELTEAAASLGVDSALSVVPYYNRPTQEGMYQHFKAIAEACLLPLILYNVPGRTVADMSNDTALRLAEIPNIIGIKDATGNLERACDLVRARRRILRCTLATTPAPWPLCCAAVTA